MNTSTNYLEKELFERLQKDTSILKFLDTSSLDGLWYWDLLQPENEWMSPKFWEVLGYDPKTKAHKASEWQDIIFSEDLDIALDNFNKHSENPDHPYDQIVRYKHKLGHTVYIRCRGMIIRDEQNKPIRMIGVHNNYTNLMENNLSMESILNSSMDGIMSFSPVYNTHNDIVDFIFTFSNKKACKIVGKTEKELLGKKLSEVVPGNFLPLASLDGDSLFNKYKHVVLSQKAQELEFYFEHDGIKEWFKNKSVPFKEGFTVTFSIISREKELEVQEKINSQSLMLQAISHQWRQPLAEINAIIFKVSHLIEESSCEKKLLLDELHKIENVTQFLSNTLDDFHQNLFTNKTPEPFYLDSLIQNLILLFSTSCDKHHISLINTIEDKKLCLNSFPNYLNHILFAIIQNSIEAFSQNQSNKTIKLIHHNYKDKIKLSILDNAGGIKDDIHLKLLEKNYSTKTKGQGLGLYLANLIIRKLLKGEMHLYNKADGLNVDIIVPKEVSFHE